MTTFAASPAEQATSWMLGHSDVHTRQALHSGYRARCKGSDQTEAVAWLVDMWERSTL